MDFKFNDSKIKYELSGKGPTLVLLHGFLESSVIWEAIIQSITHKYSVLTIDLPGHGESEVIRNIHSMEMMAEVVHGLMRHLNLTNVILLGHSMGGYIALAMVEKYPESIKHLILLNSTPEADSKERKKDRDRAIRLLESHPQSFIRMAINNLFTETSRDRFSSEIEKLKLEALNFPIDGIIANIYGMKNRKDRKNVLKYFEGSKLILAGKNDPLIEFSSIQDIGYQTFTPIKLLDNGHMGWLEDRDQVVKILHFID